MKFLCVPEKYEKDGQEKTSWNRIGALIDGKNGKQYVKLYTMPGVLISIFEDDKKPGKSNPSQDAGDDDFKF